MVKNNNILCIGNCGYNLSKLFEKYPQYQVYKIDTFSRKEKKYYKLKKQPNIIEYEKNVPNLTNFFKGIRGKLLLIVGGSGDISGSVLSILEQLKDKCSISILYIKPELTFLSQLKQKQNEIVYNILQQYSRSNVFEQMYIVDNEKIENILNCSNLFKEKKYQVINEAIFYCFHMLNVFKNIDSIENNFEEPIKTAKLVTFGNQILKDIKDEKMFFNLDNLREKRYYFSISEKTINEDIEFYKKIKDFIKEQKNNKENIKISYGIYKSDYDVDLIFQEQRSSDIQL